MQQKSWEFPNVHCTERSKNMRSLRNLLCLLLICQLFSCYNFKGISIPTEINTFYVDNFTLTSSEAPIDLNQRFTEELRRKIRQETKLVNDNDNPDITFTGSIQSYRINFVAPDENSTTSLNRLEIAIKINYISEKNEDDNYSKSYSDFEDYDSNADFGSIREGLIDVIIDDILERVFNDAFTDW